MANVIKPPARPFIWWYGGKHRFAKHIQPHLPERINDYWEPFVGGGAVFFRNADRIGRAHLSDLNHDLITAYLTVKDDVESLNREMALHEFRHMKMVGQRFKTGQTYFERTRDWSPRNPVNVAARIIYLSKSCYGGMIHTNKAGRVYSGESGSSKAGKVKIYDPDRLKRCSEALRKARISCRDFDTIEPGEGSVVYCDPPYDGAEHHYTANGFVWDDQVRLEAAARRWVGDGATVVLSNADTPATRELYRDWELHGFETTYTVGRGGATKKAGELVIVGKPGQFG